MQAKCLKSIGQPFDNCTNTKPKNVGIVEPRVVVKIPITKLTSPSTKSSQRDDQNVTKSLKKNKKKDRKSSKKRNNNKQKLKLVKSKNNIEKYCNGYTSSLENENLPDSYEMMKHDRLSTTLKCEPPKISRIANVKINASNDSIPSVCCNGTFGGSPVFDNVLANNPKSSNKCVFINKALNGQTTVNSTINHGKNDETGHENQFPDSCFTLVHDAETENLTTTEARCILTMQDEGKQNRITPSRNMICQSKQQAENINNTSSKSKHNAAHINNSTKKYNYRFNDNITCPINVVENENAFDISLMTNKNLKVSKKERSSFHKAKVHHETNWNKQNRNQLENENPHLSFADLVNRAKKDDFLQLGRKDRICGFATEEKDNCETNCTAKKYNPEHLQLSQNSSTVISNAIRDNKTISLRKSKLSLISSSFPIEKNNKNCSSSLMQRSFVTTNKSHEGELYCLNQSKHADENKVVCSSSQVTECIQPEQPPCVEPMSLTKNDLNRTTNGKLSMLGGMLFTNGKDDDFAHDGNDSKTHETYKKFVKSPNSKPIFNLREAEKTQNEMDEYDRRRKNVTRNFVSITNSPTVNSNIEDTSCYSSSINTNVLRSQGNEKERCRNKSLHDHYTTSNHDAQALTNDVHKANNIDQENFDYNKNCHHPEKQHETCLAYESHTTKDDLCCKEVNCTKNYKVLAATTCHISSKNQLNSQVDVTRQHQWKGYANVVNNSSNKCTFGSSVLTRDTAKEHLKNTKKYATLEKLSDSDESLQTSNMNVDTIPKTNEQGNSSLFTKKVHRKTEERFGFCQSTYSSPDRGSIQDSDEVHCVDRQESEEDLNDIFRTKSRENHIKNTQDIREETLAIENKNSKFKVTRFNLKSPDDKWMFCKERGCTFWTRKPERMDRHERCHLPDTKYYKCPDCKEFTKFYSLAKMLKHDRKAHTGVQDYECRVCEAEVTDITVHMKVIQLIRIICTCIYFDNPSHSPI